METWLLIITTFGISALLKAFFSLISTKPNHNLPPGPKTFPFISTILWLRKSVFEIESTVRSLHAKFGSIITIRLGSRPSIFLSDHSLAHQALVLNGSVFSDRPPSTATNKIVTSNQYHISASFYGPTWRLLRRNITSEILHPSRIKSYSHARKRVLEILAARIELEAKTEGYVGIMKHVQYAMFCLLVLMCFGDNHDENRIREIERVERNLVVNLRKFNIQNFWPGVTKVLLWRRWAELLRLKEEENDVLLPIIRVRRKLNEEILKDEDKDKHVLCYVDSLLELDLPEEKRKLNEDEIVSLCNEFLNAGTDTTSTALEWIMANLVKYPLIQERLFMEIKQVQQDRDDVREENLQKMQYLKTIVLEGLRRHPPNHLILPHAVTEDAKLGEYMVPKRGRIIFMAADMGWNPNVWENPMEYRPERFLSSEGEAFDITGSREIKMMPFGAGRRICPGLALAVLHLEYFVANLVWKFKWKAVEGDDIDLSEKQEVTIVMKNPLKACLHARLRD